MLRGKNQLGYIAYFVIVFAFGLFFDQLGFKSVAMSLLALSMGFMFFLPNKYSLLILLGFISFQGFLKIISNYHPVVHVGADLVVIGLFFKFIIQNSLDSKVSKIKFPPLSLVFGIHFVWLAVVFFNPHSLGIIPSLAGSKVYITMFILYFFGYLLTKDVKDIHLYFKFFIALAFIHIGFTIYQGFVGPSSVTSLHPRYAVQMKKYLTTAFRPFGLTNLPGGPSVYIYSVLPFVLYYISFSKSWWAKAMLILSLPLFGLSLLFCQVRSAIIKGIASVVLFVGFLLSSKLPLSSSRKTMSMLAYGGLAVAIVASIPFLMEASTDSFSDNTRAFERSLSSFQLDSVSTARRGAWDRFTKYFHEVPFGAGFARIGAAAGAFKELHQADTVFPKGYFFSDNLFITLLVELGFPGLMIVMLLVGLIFLNGIKAWRTEERTQLIGVQLAMLSALLAIFIGSYGGEGVIYNPESAFFWFFSGVMMKTYQKTFDQKVPGPQYGSTTP